MKCSKSSLCGQKKNSLYSRLIPMQEVALEYCRFGMRGRRRVSLRQARRAFICELKHTRWRQGITLYTMMRRRGWHGRGIPTCLIPEIRRKLGDPL